MHGWRANALGSSRPLSNCGDVLARMQHPHPRQTFNVSTQRAARDSAQRGRVIDAKLYAPARNPRREERRHGYQTTTTIYNGRIQNRDDNRPGNNIRPEASRSARQLRIIRRIIQNSTCPFLLLRPRACLARWSTWATLSRVMARVDHPIVREKCFHCVLRRIWAICENAVLPSTSHPAPTSWRR